jgi:hypothetical protein
MMSGKVGLARWWSLSGGSAKAVDGDRRDALRLEETEKGLGWPPIREENNPGKGSQVKGGWQCLWPTSGEGGGVSGAQVWTRSKGRNGGDVTHMQFEEKAARLGKRR